MDRDISTGLEMIPSRRFQSGKEVASQIAQELALHAHLPSCDPIIYYLTVVVNQLREEALTAVRDGFGDDLRRMSHSEDTLAQLRLATSHP